MKHIASAFLAAWVLWSGAGPNYRIEDTYETKAECKADIGPVREARIKRQGMELRSHGVFLHKLGETGIRFEDKKRNEEFAIQYICLPAGTNPRG